MSPVVRVRPASPTSSVPVPRPSRVRWGLAELVLAARLAGDVPLPLTLDAQPSPEGWPGERLGGPPGVGSTPREALAAELDRVDDDGPRGARAGLRDRDLLPGGALHPGVAAALHVLSGGPLSVVLDVSATLDGGEARLRSWFGVAPGLVTQLSVGGPGVVELAWFDPRSWVPELTRAVTVGPPGAGRPVPVPGRVSLPSELLAGVAKAGRDHRPDLLPAMAAAHAGRVRVGGPGEVRVAGVEDVVTVLRALAGGCRGRLRLLTTRRDRDVRPGAVSWLLLDDGWHELRPGRGATSVVSRRHDRDLGLLTAPLVQEVQRRG